MRQLKELTLDQIKLWKLNNAQLKMQIEIELRNAKQLQAELKEAELLLSKTRETTIIFHQAQIRTYQAMIKGDATSQSDDALIQALISLRKQNIQIQARIEQTKKQAEKLKIENSQMSASNMHEKYARVMANISHAADIRNTWDSLDVLEIDDYVMENGVSYDEALIAVKEKLAKYKGDCFRRRIKEGSKWSS